MRGRWREREKEIEGGEARKEGRREEREKGKMLCTRFFFIAPSSGEGSREQPHSHNLNYFYCYNSIISNCGFVSYCV